MDILATLTLLLSSFGVLALIAIFRWQAHDNYLNAKMEFAYRYAFDLIKTEDCKPLTNFGPIAYNQVISFLDDICGVIENRKKKQETLPLFHEAFIEVLQKEKVSITNLAKSTHTIRKYFNWPFFYICFVVLLSIIPQMPIIIKFIFMYVGIVTMIVASYSLFNFSYNPEDHNGFGKLLALFKRTNSQGS